MTQPLALVLYEKLLPGTQLVNRLQDLNYRVQTLADASRLLECAEEARPLLVLADLHSTRHDVRAAISRLRQYPATRHLPVIAFGREDDADLPAAQAAGITLMVSDSALLTHLPQFLEQALQVD